MCLRERVSYRLLQVHNLQVWLVAQGVYLRPEQRDTPTDLHEAQLHASVIRTDQENLFGLIEVRYVPLMVDAPPEVAGARTVARAPADQTYAHMVAIQTRRPDIERCAMWHISLAPITPQQISNRTHFRTAPVGCMS